VILTPEFLAARLAPALPEPTRALAGRQAAVLVPLLFIDDQVEILFMKRPDNSSRHPGEVSFPGGAREPSDADVVQNALREANEEMGIVVADVQVLGALHSTITVTDFAITPIVGALRTRPTLVPSPSEVADFFWTPLARLQDETLWRHEEMPWRGRNHEVWFFEGAKHLIWGATARITRDLLAITKT
jgi:8-oxo-dGTP pyrophosphatase MutT (NUDIX family)